MPRGYINETRTKKETRVVRGGQRKNSPQTGRNVEVREEALVTVSVVQR